MKIARLKFSRKLIGNDEKFHFCLSVAFTAQAGDIWSGETKRTQAVMDDSLKAHSAHYCA
jgi:hypothetical protein